MEDHNKVRRVSNDARRNRKKTNLNFKSTNDEKSNDGLVYAAPVKLEKSTMQIEDKIINLTPGVAVTVKIKAGKRRLIEYFLSPLIQYKDESLRKR